MENLLQDTYQCFDAHNVIVLGREVLETYRLLTNWMQDRLIYIPGKRPSSVCDWQNGNHFRWVVHQTLPFVETGQDPGS